MIAEVYITDKTKQKFFVEITDSKFIESSIRDLKRHLDNAKLNPNAYYFLDLETADICITMSRQK